MLKIKILIALILFCSFASPLSAQMVVFEDDFSSGFEKWELESGSWDMWDIVGSGLQAEAVVETRGTITQLIPKDLHWKHAVKNFEYELEYEPLSGADRNIGFGFEDSGTWHELHFVTTLTELASYRDNKRVFRRLVPFIMENGRKYSIKIRYEGGTIQIWIDDVQLLNESDPFYTDSIRGKLLLRAGTGYIAPTVARFDSIVFRDLDTLPEIKLPVTLFKQSDPLWKKEEYDSATNWSDRPTIGRWGCAISSVAMILDYYGHRNFPPGLEYLAFDGLDSNHTPLNPSTLNTWLKNQPDGYIQGGINWMAVTRLSSLISNAYSTEDIPVPKLEYSRMGHVSNDIHTELLSAAEKIVQEQPVILQIDGHFLVGTGIVGKYTSGDQSVDDIYIHDPAYIYTQFSKHTDRLLSTRFLTPSFTDLSYLMIVAPEGSKVILTDNNNQEITEVEQFVEYIDADESIDEDGDDFVFESTQKVLITQLVKPDTNGYFVSVELDIENSFSDSEDFEVGIYAYDLYANPTMLTAKIFPGVGSHVFYIDYQKEWESTMYSVFDWDLFNTDLQSLYGTRDIKKWYVLNYLSEITKYAQEYTAQTLIEVQEGGSFEEDPLILYHFAQENPLFRDNQMRYRNFLRSEIDRLQEFLSPNSFEYLLDQLDGFEAGLQV